MAPVSVLLLQFWSIMVLRIWVTSFIGKKI